jgi:hypothetical protein
VAIVALMLGPAIARAQPATGELEGVVLDRATELPLADVTVRLAERLSITDAEGRFRFAGVRAGRHTLTLEGPKLEPVTVDEEVTPGVRRTVRYLVSPRMSVAFESTVRAPRVERAAVVETGIAREEARRAPGAGDDPLKVIEDLPGVARATLGSGQLVVWGAAPAETRVLVDGVDVPALYHVGGWRAILGGAFIEGVSLAPGGFGAEYGRGLGGLVRVSTTMTSPQEELEPSQPSGQRAPARGVHGEAGADLLDASARLSFVIKRRIRIAVGGRYSWLDRLAGALVPSDVASFAPMPRYDDYQVQATLRLGRGERLALLFFGADDSLRRSLFAGDPARVRSDVFDRALDRVILRYAAELDGAAIDVAPWFGYDDSRTVDQFGMTPARLQSTALSAGLRAGYRRRIARPAILSVGVDLVDAHTRVQRLGSLTIPSREGDLYAFGQPPGGDVAFADDRFHVLDAAPYVSAELRAGPLTLTPGLRIDALLVEGDHLVPPIGATPVVGFSRFSWTIDPRLALAWRAHPRLLVSVAVGLYHQPPDAADLAARFGNPSLGPARALHAVAAGSLQLAPPLVAEVAGFYRQLDDLTSRSPLPSPPAGGALVQDGGGRAYGGQFLVRLASWRGLFGWLSYTASRSERRDHPTAATRLFDFDQTHVLTVVAGWQWRRWELGARFRYTTGAPRTPVVGAFFDARDDRYEPLFGPQNSIRIPDFYQLDLRVERALVWSHATLRLYLDVQNVTWQRNPEEIAYSEDWSRRAYITGLPTLAILGARVLF